MKEQQEYRAGIYTRISADDGVTDRESNSITTQKQILTRYANEHGFRVVEYYADDGYSGTNFNRPEFKRMMGDTVQFSPSSVFIARLMQRSLFV